MVDDLTVKNYTKNAEIICVKECCGSVVIITDKGNIYPGDRQLMQSHSEMYGFQSGDKQT